MKHLIVGKANAQLNSKVASFMQGRGWHQVTSWQTCIAALSTYIDSAVQTKDIVSSTLDPTWHKVVLQVKMASFYARPWYKALMASDADVIVVTSTPRSAFTDAELYQFDQVTIVDTIVDCEVLHGLSDRHQPIEVFKSTISKPGSVYTFKVVSKPSGPVGPLGPVGHSGIIEASKALMIITPQPSTITSVDQDTVPIWINLMPSKDKDPQHVLATFESAMNNPLIINMCKGNGTLQTGPTGTTGPTGPNGTTGPKGPKGNYKITDGLIIVHQQVYVQRQDIFTALLMNMLRSLKSSGLINHGALLI